MTLRSAPFSSRSKRARYLEVLHSFTLAQAQLTTLDDIVWNIAKTAIAELGFEDRISVGGWIARVRA